MKTITLFKGKLNLITFWQEYPKFKLNYWRWKKYKGTFEFGVILWGRWFICLIDYE